MENNEEKTKSPKVNQQALDEYMEKMSKTLLEKKTLNPDHVIDNLEEKAIVKEVEESEPEVDETSEASEVETADAETDSVEETKTTRKRQKSSQNGGGDEGNGNGSDRLIYKSLAAVMHDSMMPYTEHVILDRALPRVEDGLKPVQRRILYTMIELGLEPDKPHKKSARIVGDCLGKYHPHGDSSVYDAMVRLAQPHNLRMPLVDGHGNFGSVDGDPAAAYRYTEARLRPLALEMVKDIDKETVKFVLNFNDELKEPETLPGKFPNLLVNGATGIAVGLTTSIPPHNLGEVIDGVIAYIDNPKITLKEIMKHIKGPDFPTGGYLLAGEELISAYETGKGKVAMRAKLHTENQGEKKNIVITEISYQVNKAKLLQDINELREEKKQTVLGQIAEVVDESDRSGMRGVIKLKKDANVEKIIRELYKQTSLQLNFSINMIAIANGKPEQMGLIKIISYFTEYQRDIIYKRSKYELEQAKEREHILEGLIVAIKNIDEVVKIIKKSANTTEARQKLKDKFNLSDRQAQAILDMRLARLTSLEVYKLEQELKEVKELIKRLTAIINSKKLQLDIVKQELTAIKRAYKDDRRSEIVKSFDNFEIPDEDDEKPAQDVVVAFTVNGMIKRIPMKNYSMSQKEFNDKTTEFDLYSNLYYTETDKTILVFTNKCNCFKINVDQIPECKLREKGTPVKNVLKGFTGDETAIFAIPFKEALPAGQLVFFTKQGMVKKTDLTEYALLKSAFQGAKLKDDDEIINIEMFNEKATMLFVTKQGMVLNAEAKDVPLQGRISGGVKGINLADGDECAWAGQAETAGCVALVTNLGNGKRVKVKDIDLMARYRKGLKLLGLNAGEEIVFAKLIEDASTNLIFKIDEELSVKYVDKIGIEPRTGKGKSLTRLAKSERISSVWEFKK